MTRWDPLSVPMAWFGHEVLKDRKYYVAAQQNQQNDLRAQRRLKSALAFAQSDHSLRCPHERSIRSLATHSVLSEDWSDWEDTEADLSLGWAHISFLLVLPCCGSFIIVTKELHVHVVNYEPTLLQLFIRWSFFVQLWKMQSEWKFETTFLRKNTLQCFLQYGSIKQDFGYKI